MAGGLGIAAVVGFGAASAPAPAPAPPEGRPVVPPSILLVTFDTLRADHVGCYGDTLAETPNLDALAQGGVLFEEARSHVPLTLPSHATILTGLLPPRHGLRANGLFKLDRRAPTLAGALRSKGYATGAVVSSIVLDRACGLDLGFDIYDDNQRVGDRTAFDYLERAASQVADAVARELPRLSPPFFLWVHLYDPHKPWVPPNPFRARHSRRLYRGEIAFADAAFGEIRRRASARAGGSLFVAAVADHGESLGDHGENQHGYTLHRGVLRVPLVLAGPGLPRGVRVKSTAGLVDLAPTLADLAGGAMNGADGRSLRPLWEAARPVPASGRAQRPRGDAATGGTDTDLWEESLHPLYDSGWAPLRGLLTRRWHFVEAPRPELYDRASDPDDRRDVSASNPVVIEELRTRLSAIGVSLGDVAEPAVAQGDSPEERERLEKLASLGYLTGGTARSVAGERLDPKDGLPGFIAVETAEELIEAGEAGKARDLLEPHTRRDPGNPRLWHQLGRALAETSDGEGSVRALRKAVELDGRSEFIRYTYADVLRGRGDEPAARAQLEAILRANPRAVDASLGLAAMALSKGEGGRAETILRASYDAGARDPDLLGNLGLLCLRTGKRDEAARFFDETLALRPDDPLAQLEAGRAALRSGDSSRAIRLLRGCVSGARAFECRMELARAYVLGPRDFAAARLTLRGARDVAGDDSMRTEVDKRLEAIDQMERGR